MKLAVARAQKLFTQASLARAAGVNRSTIHAIEADKWTPAPETVRKLCATLGVEPAEIDEFQRAIARWAEGKEPARAAP
jgi:DNA-binding XRE family transcriptional regulator